MRGVKEGRKRALSSVGKKVSLIRRDPSYRGRRKGIEIFSVERCRFKRGGRFKAGKTFSFRQQSSFSKRRGVKRRSKSPREFEVGGEKKRA